MSLNEKEQDEVVERQIEEALLEDELAGRGDSKAEEKEEQKPAKWKILLEWGIYVAIVVIGIFVVPRYIMQRTVVSGDSMENTLYEGQSLLVSKISYAFDDPDRFDIIIFYPHGKAGEDEDEYYTEDEFFVKRVIGLPGETVQIKDSKIYINGELLEENYGKDSDIAFAGIAEEPVTVGEDEYFVLGDNREVSYDSRYEEIGMIKRKNIEAKVMLRIWPLKDFGTID